MAHDLSGPQTGAGDPHWERAALERIALASLQEQRRSRRWGIFFKMLGFVYLFALLFVALGWIGRHDGVSPTRHTAVVEINGLIAPDHPGAAENVNAGLQEAFKDKATQGVVLRINSPGGSPVQAAQINSE